MLWVFWSFTDRKYQVFPARSQSCFTSTHPASDVEWKYLTLNTRTGFWNVLQGTFCWFWNGLVDKWHNENYFLQQSAEDEWRSFTAGGLKLLCSLICFTIVIFCLQRLSEPTWKMKVPGSSFNISLGTQWDTEQLQRLKTRNDNEDTHSDHKSLLKKRKPTTKRRSAPLHDVRNRTVQVHVNMLILLKSYLKTKK